MQAKEALPNSFKFGGTGEGNPRTCGGPTPFWFVRLPLIKVRYCLLLEIAHFYLLSGCFLILPNIASVFIYGLGALGVFVPSFE